MSDMFPARVLLEHKYKMTGDCYVFKFLQRLVWTENVWSVVFKFPMRSMDGPNYSYMYNYMCRENNFHYSIDFPAAR